MCDHVNVGGSSVFVSRQAVPGILHQRKLLTEKTEKIALATMKNATQ